LEETGRPLLGIEKFAIQGIFVQTHVVPLFDNDFWSDLAGNAFCGGVVLTIALAVLLVLAKKHADPAPPEPLWSSPARPEIDLADLIESLSK